MIDAEILEFYRRGLEGDRLTAGTGLLEFLRTVDVLERVLPAAPADVLDVGGATGRYAAVLAAAGHRVHVVDPVPEHVAAAAARPGVTAAVGDARDLPAATGSYDAVLLLGPLYHLTARADRVRAWREAARALRPSGVAAGATISRFAPLLDGFAKGYHADPRFRDIVDAGLGSGVHRGPADEPRYFTTAYLHHPDEPAAEPVEAGLRAPRVVAVEGPLWLLGGRLDEILADPGRRATALDLLRRVEDEPSLLGASSHHLTVARAAT
ncbi:class I SAM-dependent methyltransferase [Spirilliplanes yamanashiensis]|uniref:class I SAM-dependent methyltransferase n=1 Tax=Spirilliplanes yamanashiensis TaxID=42233 RepID=UPI001951551B|nr:class I SAM-dependent methyltransferase [Spirilliplanes yamanashiensis]MDP9817171.1 SAM-dependent methyltransferase [Spirilliplanes yamanashiensis]